MERLVGTTKSAHDLIQNVSIDNGSKLRLKNGPNLVTNFHITVFTHFKFKTEHTFCSLNIRKNQQKVLSFALLIIQTN